MKFWRPHVVDPFADFLFISGDLKSALNETRAVMVAHKWAQRDREDAAFHHKEAADRLLAILKEDTERGKL